MRAMNKQSRQVITQKQVETRIANCEKALEVRDAIEESLRCWPLPEGYAIFLDRDDYLAVETAIGEVVSLHADTPEYKSITWAGFSIDSNDSPWNTWRYRGLPVYLSAGSEEMGLDRVHFDTPVEMMKKVESHRNG